jgi:hypothetical protein
VAAFRVKAVKPFYFDARRIEIGDAIELDELTVARDLLDRGLVVTFPMPINGSGPAEVIAARQVH